MESAMESAMESDRESAMESDSSKKRLGTMDQKETELSHLQFAACFDELCDTLLRDIQETLPAHPLEPVVIVTPWHGIDQAISLRMSEKYSICANVRFFQPKDYIQKLVSELSENYLEDSFPYELSGLLWRIFSIIRQVRNQESISLGKSNCSEKVANLAPFTHSTNFSWQENFTLLFRKNRLRDDYQLACRLAKTYDECLAFHPDRLRHWLTDDAEPAINRDDRSSSAWVTKYHEFWVAGIFRLLVQEEAIFHSSELQDFLFVPIKANESGMPAKRTTGNPNQGKSLVFFFNVHWFNHLHLRILDKCQSRLKIFRYFLVSHPLTLDRTAFMKGKHAQEAQDQEAQDQDVTPILQADQIPKFILENEKIVRNSLQRMQCLPEKKSAYLSLKIKKIPNPKQMMIRNTSSPWMEINSLYHFVLHMLSKNPDFTLNDFIVYVQDLPTYAPLISCIFDNPVHPIKNVIVQRLTPQAEQVAIVLLWEFLSQPFSKHSLQIFLQASETSQFFYHLKNPSINPGGSTAMGYDAEHASSDSDKWKTLFDWLDACGFRCGTEGEYGLTAALRRLCLSLGMDHSFSSFSVRCENISLTPCLNIPVGNLDLLDEYVGFLEKAVIFSREIQKLKKLGTWIHFTKKIVKAFLPRLDDLFVERVTRAAEQCEQQSIFLEKLDYEFFYDAFLNENLSQPHGGTQVHGSHYFSRGILFLPLQPFHFVTKKVSCVIGLHNDEFPRSDERFDFHVTDISEFQSVRAKDRLLFVNIFCNTRDVFYASYNRPIENEDDISDSGLTDITKENLSLALQTLSGATHLISDLIEDLLEPITQKFYTNQTTIELGNSYHASFSELYFHGDSLQNYRISDFRIACHFSGQSSLDKELRKIEWIKPCASKTSETPVSLPLSEHQKPCYSLQNIFQLLHNSQEVFLMTQYQIAPSLLSFFSGTTSRYTEDRLQEELPPEKKGARFPIVRDWLARLRENIDDSSASLEESALADFSRARGSLAPQKIGLYHIQDYLQEIPFLKILQDSLAHLSHAHIQTFNMEIATKHVKVSDSLHCFFLDSHTILQMMLGKTFSLHQDLRNWLIHLFVSQDKTMQNQLVRTLCCNLEKQQWLPAYFTGEQINSILLDLLELLRKLSFEQPFPFFPIISWDYSALLFSNYLKEKKSQFWESTLATSNTVPSTNHFVQILLESPVEESFLQDLAQEWESSENLSDSKHRVVWESHAVRLLWGKENPFSTCYWQKFHEASLRLFLPMQVCQYLGKSKNKKLLEPLQEAQRASQQKF